jgi:hypothetical protein
MPRARLDMLWIIGMTLFIAALIKLGEEWLR